MRRCGRQTLRLTQSEAFASRLGVALPASAKHWSEGGGELHRRGAPSSTQALHGTRSNVAERTVEALCKTPYGSTCGPSSVVYIATPGEASPALRKRLRLRDETSFEHRQQECSLVSRKTFCLIETICRGLTVFILRNIPAIFVVCLSGKLNKVNAMLSGPSVPIPGKLNEAFGNCLYLLWDKISVMNAAIFSN